MSSGVHLALYDKDGQRKYLNPKERRRFLKAVLLLPDASERALCLTLLYTGCRISEALELTVTRVDIDDGCIVFKTLKQRVRDATRPIPVPAKLMTLLRGLIKQGKLSGYHRIWTISRATAWRIVKRCMAKAGICGKHACPKGLRHGFGVACILKGIAVTLIQRWMGHAKLETTKIYLYVIGPEERRLMRQTWPT